MTLRNFASLFTMLACLAAVGTAGATGSGASQTLIYFTGVASAGDDPAWATMAASGNVASASLSIPPTYALLQTLTSPGSVFLETPLGSDSIVNYSTTTANDGDPSHLEAIAAYLEIDPYADSNVAHSAGHAAFGDLPGASTVFTVSPHSAFEVYGQMYQTVWFDTAGTSNEFMVAASGGFDLYSLGSPTFPPSHISATFDADSMTTGDGETSRGLGVYGLIINNGDDPLQFAMSAWVDGSATRISPVDEPASFGLELVGLALLGWRFRRQAR